MKMRESLYAHVIPYDNRKEITTTYDNNISRKTHSRSEDYRDTITKFSQIIKNKS